VNSYGFEQHPSTIWDPATRQQVGEFSYQGGITNWNSRSGRALTSGNSVIDLSNTQEVIVFEIQVITHLTQQDELN